jgi:hypothetical protein
MMSAPQTHALPQGRSELSGSNDIRTGKVAADGRQISRHARFRKATLLVRLLAASRQKPGDHDRKEEQSWAEIDLIPTAFKSGYYDCPCALEQAGDGLGPSAVVLAHACLGLELLKRFACEGAQPSWTI